MITRVLGLTYAPCMDTYTNTLAGPGALGIKGNPLPSLMGSPVLIITFLGRTVPEE